MRKLTGTLAVIFRDALLRLFLILLTIKLIIFTTGIGLDMESFLPAFGAILITIAPSLLMQNNCIKVTYLSVINAAFSLLFFINALYFRYFDDFVSLYDLAQLHQLNAVSNIVAEMIGRELFFVADFVVLPVLFFKRRVNEPYDRSTRRMTIAGLILVSLVCNVNPLNFNFLVRSKINFLESIFSRHDFVGHLGVVNYQLIDAYFYLTTRMQKSSVTDEEVGKVAAWHKARKRSSGTNALTGTGRGMNLIIIQVESLQNFVIGHRHQGREITPTLNALAQRGIYFRNIYDQTAAGNSSDATLLANSSLYPSRKGAVSFLYPHNEFDSLPKILQEEGYATAVMHAYKKSFWNHEVFEKSLGFALQFYEDDYVVADRIGWGITGLDDRSFFSQSLRKISEIKSPFYVFLRTLSTHAPFAHITPEIDNFPVGDIEGEIIGYYLRAMHYIDAAIGEFLKGLSELRPDAHNVVVIYGDHRARLPRRELTRIGITDPEENRKIPLIVWYPGAVHQNIDTVGGLIDVAPTVSNVLGVDVASRFFLGNDLASGNKGYAIFRDGSYVGGDDEYDAAFMREQLLISDLTLEKDIIPLIRKGTR